MKAEDIPKAAGLMTAVTHLRSCLSAVRRAMKNNADAKPGERRESCEIAVNGIPREILYGDEAMRVLEAYQKTLADRLDRAMNEARALGVDFDHSTTKEKDA